MSESVRLCIRQGMIVDGCAWQPLMWERPTSENVGSASPGAARRGTTTRTGQATARTGTERGANEQKELDAEGCDDDAAAVQNVLDLLVEEIEAEAERVDDRPGTTAHTDVPRPSTIRTTHSRSPLGARSGENLDEDTRPGSGGGGGGDPTPSGRPAEDPTHSPAIPKPRRRERWPTPRAVDGNELETSVALPLSVHVAVRELRALHGDVAPARPRQPQGRAYAEPTEPRLHLNPAFSEWLMGLPAGWTCLDDDVVDGNGHLAPHDLWASCRHPADGEFVFLFLAIFWQFLAMVCMGNCIDGVFCVQVKRDREPGGARGRKWRSAWLDRWTGAGRWVTAWFPRASGWRGGC